jgi:hypothetical protein
MAGNKLIAEPNNTRGRVNLAPTSNNAKKKNALAVWQERFSYIYA